MRPHGVQAGADFEDGEIILDISSSNHHGIALWPVPSTDPTDPIRWSRPLKVVAFLAASLCNFTANVSGAGVSVAIPMFIEDFRKSANEVNGLVAVGSLTEVTTLLYQILTYDSTISCS